ncbi:hypothetical protein ISN44_As07g014300 [Arabidopsis suecica]|uniref:Uncharacterized protein n=1 Tax=Arabidopsis suecica TaxID=45249 RepID=A0A8T2BQJ9_ARASU|nr:hypothetical protein ISN44_As07g014300 [Arabidopsis suecica]
MFFRVMKMEDLNILEFCKNGLVLTGGTRESFQIDLHEIKERFELNSAFSGEDSCPATNPTTCSSPPSPPPPSSSSSSSISYDSTNYRKFEGLDVNKEDLLDQSLDVLYEKEVNERLAFIVAAFNKDLQHEFIEKSRHKIKRKHGRKLLPPKNATNKEVKSKAVITP